MKQKNKNYFLKALLGISVIVLLWPGHWACAENSKMPPQLDKVTKLKMNRDTTYYTLRVGDRIKITIYPEDEYIKGGEMEISSEGNITLPLVGKANIEGMLVINAENKLAKIIDADYLVNPEVVIEVLKEKMRTINISILGEVKKPSTYELETRSDREITLLKAISEAGGFSDIANIKKIKIRRNIDGKSSVLRANAEAIIKGKDPDIVLEEGDVVHVSESLF